MDKQFNSWVVNLSEEYRRSQIKASIRVNSELIRFYFKLGKEINETSFKKQYGKSFFKTLSLELTKRIPNAKGFSARNLWYIESFYMLYRKILQQVAAKFKTQSEISDYDSLVNQIFLTFLSKKSPTAIILIDGYLYRWGMNCNYYIQS